jgi:hypothetical protein
MRKRLVLTAAAFAALALAVPAALASSGPAVLDGKKITKLTLTAAATAQSNDAALVTDLADGTDRMACQSPRCAVLPFVYKPAKGVKGDVAFSLTWGTPGSDFDLYVVSIDKHGDRTQLASCGASAGQSEKIFLTADNFKAGKTYGLLADFYRTPGETVTGTVQMPGTNTTSTSFPAAVEDASGFKVNCGL